MAITFKYGAPGPILQAGFAAGVGNRLKRQQDDALEIWERQNQQQFQAEQAAIGRQFQFGLQQQQFGQQLELQGRAFDQRSLEDQQQRAFQAEQAGLGRDFQAEQNKALIDARAAEAGREREHDFELASRRNDYNIQAGLRSGELELPPEAHRRLDQLESGRVYAMTLDPAQEKEFMEQYESEKRELLGLAQPARQPSIEEQFAQNTFESGGTLYQRGKDGGFDVLREAPEDPSQQFNDAVVKRYETLRKQKNEDTGEMISDEQAQRQAISDEMATAQFRQRLSGSQTGLPSPTQPQTAPGIAGPVAELPDQSRRQQASPPTQKQPVAQPQLPQQGFSPTGMTPEQMRGVAGLPPADEALNVFDKLERAYSIGDAEAVEGPAQEIAELFKGYSAESLQLFLEDRESPAVAVLAQQELQRRGAQPQAPQAPAAQPQMPQQPVAQAQLQQGFTPSPMHQLGQHYNSLPPDYNSLLATSGEIKTERDLIQQSSAAIQQLSPEDLAVVHANVASLPSSAQYGRLKGALLPIIQAEIQKRKANPPMQPGDVNLAVRLGNAVPVQSEAELRPGMRFVAPDGSVRFVPQ